MNQDTSYRIATSGDAPALANLMVELGYQPSGAELTATMEQIRAGQGEIFVAEKNGHIIGCVTAIMDVRLAEGQTGEITSLVVGASHRGEGVGRGLVAWAEQWLKTKTNRVRVRANVLRADSHSFYRARGYREIKAQKVFAKNL